LDGRGAFLRGFRAMVPLWLGVVPFGLAYAVVARAAGLSALETQALSLLVFAGSAQFSAAGLFGRGAGGIEIVFTTFLLNVRHVLYGLALSRTVRLPWRRRLPAAFLLTDEAFGVAAASRERSFPRLLGVELSLFVTWNLATAGGIVLGSAIRDPAELGVDFVFPLAFLALLVPLLRRRVDVAVALTAGVTAWLVSRVEQGGVPIVVAGVAGAALGAVLTRHEPPPPAIDPEQAVRGVA
jgi:4-azaleucine resistance transporter AzlC